MASEALCAAPFCFSGIRYRKKRAGAETSVNRKRFKKTPLWEWSYNNPILDQKLAKIHKSVKELDGFLRENKEKGKRTRKK